MCNTQPPKQFPSPIALQPTNANPASTFPLGMNAQQAQAVAPVGTVGTSTGATATSQASNTANQPTIQQILAQLFGSQS